MGIATSCYGDSFTIVFVDDVRTSQETSCYGDSFTSVYVDGVRTSQETQPVTEIALLFILLRVKLLASDRGWCTTDTDPTIGYEHCVDVRSVA
jgi:hypothetical protein